MALQGTHIVLNEFRMRCSLYPPLQLALGGRPIIDLTLKHILPHKTHPVGRQLMELEPYLWLYFGLHLPTSIRLTNKGHRRRTGTRTWMDNSRVQHLLNLSLNFNLDRYGLTIEHWLREYGNHKSIGEVILVFLKYCFTLINDLLKGGWPRLHISNVRSEDSAA